MAEESTDIDNALASEKPMPSGTPLITKPEVAATKLYRTNSERPKSDSGQYSEKYGHIALETQSERLQDNDRQKIQLCTVGEHSTTVNILESADEEQARVVPTVAFQRDYSRGTICQFDTAFPPAFDGLISPTAIAETLEGVNEILWRAEETNARTVFERVLATLTLYLSTLFVQSRYAKCLRELDHFIAEQNDKYYLGKGAEVRNPLETGLRLLIIGPVRNL